MRGHPSISPVYRLMEPPRPTAEEELASWGRIEKLRRDAWQRLGVIVTEPGQLPPRLAAELKQWAEDNYGRR